MRMRNLALILGVLSTTLLYGGCSGCDDENIGTVVILPDIAAEASITEGTFPLEVSFDLKSNNANVLSDLTVLWNFGDGTEPSSEVTPTHIFTAPGTYQVSVEVSNTAGSDTASLSINVFETLKLGEVSATPSMGQVPLAVQFVADASGGIAPLSYRWDFGDGGVSVVATPNHTYTTAQTFTAEVTVTDAAGTTVQGSVDVEVAADDVPSASATASPTSGAAPLEVAFQGVGLGGDAPLSYAWNFGDGSSSSAQNPSHTFMAAGTYEVKLVVTDNDGDQDDATIQINVLDNSQPTLEITADAELGIAPLTTRFDATIVGGNAPVTIAWDFGDETTSIVEDPTHTFEAGVYDVTATVTDADGDTTADTVTITVAEDTEPSVTALAAPAMGIAPLGVEFTCQATSGNAPLQFRWDFGNGQSSDLANPSFTFTEPGMYNASCTVTDTDGDVITSTVSVVVSPDQVPEANIQADPLAGLAPLNVSFQAGAVGGDAPLTYAWDFGGLGDSSEENPSFDFEQPGVYTIVLVVTDADGDSNSDSVDVSVGNDDQPVVEISADVSSGIEPLTVSFDATIAGGNAPVTVAWDFGDETASTIEDPTHTFPAGEYEVAVTVTDTDGDSSTDTITITVDVDSDPEIAATATPTEGIAPLTVNFTCPVAANTGNSPFTFAWAFGNGQSSDLASPSFTYTEPGTYNASCTVTDTDGDVVTSTVSVVVSPDQVPEANIQADPLAGLAPLNVSFQAGAVGGDAPLTYAWDFGGLGDSSEENPSFDFEQPGVYTIVLVVTDADGDSNSDRVDVSVGNDDQPVVEVSVDVSSGIEPLTVSFDATIAGGNAPVTVAWDFGDETTSIVEDPTHTFPAGEYEVVVTVTDADGDSNTDTITITVDADVLPEVTTDASPVSGLEPLTVDFNCNVDEETGNAPFTFGWDFGNGQTSALQNPSFTYTVSGDYTATCTVTDVDGDTVLSTTDIEVIADLEPEVTIVASPVVGLAPLMVDFEAVAESGNAPLTFAWNFADQGNADTAQASFSFVEPGTYAVQVTVTDSDGDTNTDIIDITVAADEVPSVEITADVTSGIEPLTVAFAANTAGGDAPLSYAWDFADETTSQLVTPTHTFSAGTYEVSATVTDNDDDSDTDTIIITVDADLQPTVDDVSINTLSGIEDQTVFVFSCAASGGNAPLRYRWDFGNGQSSNLQNPSFTYTEPGNFVATCTVIDANEDSSVASIGPIQVDEDEDVAFTISASPMAGLAFLEVDFAADVVSGNAPLTYDWNFGDGFTSEAIAPVHTFTEVGTYQASLTVTDVDGDTSSRQVTISVGSPDVPAVTATADPETGAAPLLVSFDCEVAEGTGNPPFTYRWSFGDGATSSQPTPTHTYNAIGNYLATCMVTDTFGQMGLGEVSISANDPNDPPVIEALLIDNGIPESEQTCAVEFQTTIQFQLDASDPNPNDVLSYAWSFTSVPEGASPQFNNSTVSNPSFDVGPVGDYVVLVRVSDGRGGVTNTTTTITAQGADTVTILGGDFPDATAGQLYDTPIQAAVFTDCGLPYNAPTVDWSATNAAITSVTLPDPDSNISETTVTAGCDIDVSAAITASLTESGASSTVDVPVVPGPAEQLLLTYDQDVPVHDDEGAPVAMNVLLESTDTCGNPVQGDPVDLNLSTFGEACFETWCINEGPFEMSITFEGSATVQIYSHRAGPAGINVDGFPGRVGNFVTQINDFESEAGPFFAEHPEWEWGTPAIGANSGQQAWATVLDGNYTSSPNPVELRTLRGFFPMPCTDEPAPITLRFAHNYALGDQEQVSVTTMDNQIISPSNTDYNGLRDLFGSDIPGFQGTSQDWEALEFDLSDFNCADMIDIGFHLIVDNNGSTDYGWAIDDVELEFFSEQPTGNFVAGSPFSGSVETLNEGVAGCEIANGLAQIMVFDMFGNPTPSAEVNVLAFPALQLEGGGGEGGGGAFASFFTGPVGEVVSDDGQGTALIRLNEDGVAQFEIGFPFSTLLEILLFLPEDSNTFMGFFFQNDEHPEDRGTCSDGLDNNCNGLIDCDEDACSDDEELCTETGVNLVVFIDEVLFEQEGMLVNYSVFNTGSTVFEGCFNLDFYASDATNEEPNLDSAFAPGGLCASIAPGDSVGDPNGFAFLPPPPSNVLWAYVDPIPGDIDELEEEDNLSDPFALIPEELPNLEVQIDNVPFEFQVDFSLSNTGLADIEECVLIHFYVTDGRRPGPFDDSDFQTTDCPDGLPPGSTQPSSTDSIPLISGYLWARADPFPPGEIPESNEDDNLSHPYLLGDTAEGPDFVVDLDGVSSIGDGLFRFDWSVTNIGTVDANIGDACIDVSFAITDGTDPNESDFFDFDSFCAFLGAGDTTTGSYVTEGFFPPNPTAWAFVDLFEAFEETDENNNLSRPVPIELPDL